ncbi:MAG: hypothetical protein ACRDTH_01645 [Pseudonocardiaceae bacterium]
MHLMRDGRPVADLVPAGADSRAVQAQQAARAVTERMADRFGAPTLAHYRQVYESCGQPCRATRRSVAGSRGGCLLTEQ